MLSLLLNARLIACERKGGEEEEEGGEERKNTEKSTSIN